MFGRDGFPSRPRTPGPGVRTFQKQPLLSKVAYRLDEPAEAALQRRPYLSWKEAGHWVGFTDMEPWKIGERTFQSRLLVGTGKFPSVPAMQSALEASGTEIVTVALRRVDLTGQKDPQADMLEYEFVGRLVDRQRAFPETRSRRFRRAVLFVGRRLFGHPFFGRLDFFGGGLFCFGRRSWHD